MRTGVDWIWPSAPGIRNSALMTTLVLRSIRRSAMLSFVIGRLATSGRSRKPYLHLPGSSLVNQVTKTANL